MSKLDQNINSGCYRGKRPDARIYYKYKWWCEHCIDKLEDAEQMSEESQKINQDQPLVWVPPPDPPNPYLK